MLHSRIPLPVARQMLAPMGVVSAEPLAAGMSGAFVFRLALATGELRALKRWPLETAPDRVAEVDRVLIQSRRRGCLHTPRLHSWGESTGTCFFHRGGCWQVMDWVAGSPLEPTADLGRIERGAAMIAAFHASVVDLGKTEQPAPAIAARLRRVEELTPIIAEISTQTDPISSSSSLASILAASLDQARQTVVWNWNEVSARITRSLCLDAYSQLSCQYVLRDIHREHALFEGDEPSGLIDFDAVRIDTPWTDLARWTGSFLGFRHESQQLWDAALAGFCGENAFKKSSEMEFGERLATDLCFATTWIGLANWLVWLTVERRRFEASPSEISARIDQLRLLAVLGI